MKFSALAARMRRELGIYDLMDDLGTALAGGGDVAMLGGGNPAAITEVHTACDETLAEIAGSRGGLARLFTDYDPPHGPMTAREAVAGYLADRYGWRVGPEHVAFVPGSQATFGYLFSMFGGSDGAGHEREVWLPLAPEYVGYFGAASMQVPVRAFAPVRSRRGPHRFKFCVDAEGFDPDARCGLVALSVPTNPTGNLVTQHELDDLARRTRARGVPLVVDLAYGAPFPDIGVREVIPPFGDEVILALSLSKLGLPGVRTGIVVAAPEVVELVARFNAAAVLAGPNVGPALLTGLIESKRLDPLCRDVIGPFYTARRRSALEIADRHLAGLEYAIHEPEGAFFLWLEFPGLAIDSRTLYERLKARGVIVLPGTPFVGDAPVDDATRQRSLRVSYAQPDAVLERGFEAIAREIAGTRG